jgi:hypothetical protein
MQFFEFKAIASSSAKRFLASILLLSFIGTLPARSEDLCESNELQLVSSNGRTAVYLRGIDSIRFLSNLNCVDARDCSYALEIDSGEDYTNIMTDLNIQNICTTTELSTSKRNTNEIENLDRTTSLFPVVFRSEYVFRTSIGYISVNDLFYTFGDEQPEWGVWDSDTSSGGVIYAPVHVLQVFTFFD